MKRHQSEPIYTDPVCGMQLSRNTAAEELEYDGKTYYFCADICHEAFKADPEQYIHQHRQHGAQRS